MNNCENNVASYELRYKEGYGLIYPEGHIIRVHKHILEWEFGLSSGRIFDFGCGAGSHLRYFADHGFEPFGCDTSSTAIRKCREMLPEYRENFVVTLPLPRLRDNFQHDSFDIFLSNQVLYFLDDIGIKHVASEAAKLLKPRGIFIVTMMSYSCWYYRYVVDQVGDFKRVQLDTPRQKGELLINFKNLEELPDLFPQFEPAHLGSYGSHIRQEEGPTTHWLYVGTKR